VDTGSAVGRSSWEPEPVWRRPVAKPGMPDVLWEATRTETLREDEFRRIRHAANYERYQVCKPPYCV